MDEQNLSRIEQLLQDSIELAEENNELLLKIQRTMRWSFWGKFILWAAVLILPFFFLGPLIQAIVPVSSTSEGSKSILGLPSGDQIQSLIEAYKASGSTSNTQ